MNNNKNIKLNSIDNSYNLISNMDNDPSTSQLIPAHTHTMTINLRDDDGNIIPTTVTLNFFFTSHNPNDVPIYAEFTKLDSNNNPIYKTNFSFTGVEDMGLPIAEAILHGNNISNSQSDIDDETITESEIETKSLNYNKLSIDDIYKDSISHCRSKVLLKNVLNQHFDINKFNSSMTFEDIFTIVIKLCNSVEGLGNITFYEIAKDICKFYKINISHIYLIRSETKKAISLLNINKSCFNTTKFHNLSIKFVNLETIKLALKNKNYILPFESNNAILYEDFLNNNVK